MPSRSTRPDRDGRDSPLFCPACRRPRSADARLCAHCGDTLIAQGFCAVCGQYWLIPEGADCPKHDLTLGRAPDAREFPDDSDKPRAWSTIATFAHSIQAHGPRLRLESEGIPTFLDGERMAGHSGSVAGAVRLQVPLSLAADALSLLDRRPDRVDEEDDDDTPESDEPSAGRRSLLAWAVGLFAAVVLIRGIGAALGL